MCFVEIMVTNKDVFFMRILVDMTPGLVLSTTEVIFSFCVIQQNFAIFAAHRYDMLELPVLSATSEVTWT